MCPSLTVSGNWRSVIGRWGTEWICSRVLWAPGGGGGASSVWCLWVPWRPALPLLHLCIPTAPHSAWHMTNILMGYIIRYYFAKNNTEVLLACNYQSTTDTMGNKQWKRGMAGATGKYKWLQSQELRGYQDGRAGKGWRGRLMEPSFLHSVELDTEALQSCWNQSWSFSQGLREGNAWHLLALPQLEGVVSNSGKEKIPRIEWNTGSWDNLQAASMCHEGILPYHKMTDTGH